MTDKDVEQIKSFFRSINNFIVNINKEFEPHRLFLAELIKSLKENEHLKKFMVNINHNNPPLTLLNPHKVPLKPRKSLKPLNSIRVKNINITITKEEEKH